MNESTLPARIDPRQAMKWVVYSLLFVNWILYVSDDIEFASYTMRDGGSLLDWTASFATTIDVAAWLTLLFLFELETYVLSDETLDRPRVTRLLHAVRLICYLSLAHSVYAFSWIYFDLMQVNVIPEITDLCALVAPDMSFVRNLEYTDLSLANCSTLSTDTAFYHAEPNLVITDTSGLSLERWLAFVDVAEVLTWLIILATIEIMVRLQDQGITRGSLMSTLKLSKWILYSCLWAMAAYWTSLGHYYYAWDEALWILGFLAIESNVSQWKQEIEDEQALAAG